MYNKTVTGSAEDLKLVKNGKSSPKTPMGSTGRTSFEGSRDNRAAGTAGPNQVLKTAPGYIDQGPTMIGDISHSRMFTTAGARGSMAGAAKTAKEDVTNGMGGKFKKGTK